MPSLSDILTHSGTPLAEALNAGLKDISYSQQIVFRPFRRVVLPSDGFVFWIASGAPKTVPGSLHAQTQNTQDAWQSFDNSTIIFTTSEEVHPFHDNDQELATVWVGTWEGTSFTIGSRRSRYTQAGLHHYVGHTIPPSFAGQFLETAAQLDALSPMVSSSLPLFLSMGHETPPALSWCAWPSSVAVFPSFAVPDNQPPPYVSVHNDPHSVTPLGMGTLDPASGTTDQLVKERVRLHMVGVPHQQASTVLTFITRWALLHWDIMGVLNTPVLRDEKNPLADINTLAALKTCDIDVMYSQKAIRHQALQTIQHAKALLPDTLSSPIITHAHPSVRTS